MIVSCVMCFQNIFDVARDVYLIDVVLSCVITISTAAGFSELTMAGRVFNAAAFDALIILGAIVDVAERQLDMERGKLWCGFE